MGNVNGREEGDLDSPSAGRDMAAEDGGVIVDGEFMGPSPPSSPRAAQSPLMFTPQVSSFHFILHTLCFYVF